MDHDPQDNQSSEDNNYQPQYHWLSPLRDIQPSIFNPEIVPNPEDNPISGIDSELFAERATNTSAETGSSTCAGYQHRDVQISNQSFTWPTMSTTGADLMSNRTSRQPDAHWPTYQGQNVRTTEENTKTPSTNSAYPNIALSLDPLQRDHGSTERQSCSHTCRNQHTSNESDTRTTQTQFNINWGQGNQQEREIRNENHPLIPQHRTRLPHPQTNILENNANFSLAPIGTPSTSSGFG